MYHFAVIRAPLLINVLHLIPDMTELFFFNMSVLKAGFYHFSSLKYWLSKFSMNISTNGTLFSLGLYLQGVPEKKMVHVPLLFSCQITIQLPFFYDNLVALFGQQSSCPSWLTQVKFWFIFYDCLSMTQSLQNRLEK